MAMNSNKTNAQHQWDIDMSFSDSHRLSEVVLTYPFGMTQNTAKVLFVKIELLSSINCFLW